MYGNALRVDFSSEAIGKRQLHVRQNDPDRQPDAARHFGRWVVLATLSRAARDGGCRGETRGLLRSRLCWSSCRHAA